MSIMTKVIGRLAMLVANQTANSTCWVLAYQERIPTVIDKLRKYRD